MHSVKIDLVVISTTALKSTAVDVRENIMIVECMCVCVEQNLTFTEKFSFRLMTNKSSVRSVIYDDSRQPNKT